MVIAVNTRLLLANRLTGLGHYTREILKQMVLSHPEHVFIFLFDRPYNSEFIFAENVIPVIVSPQARAAPLYLTWFDFSIPKVLKKYNPDVFISMDNFTSLRMKIPNLLIIHDLAYLHYPEHMDWLHRWYIRRYTPRFIAHATLIGTVSEATKEDIITQFNVPPEKVCITSLGLNEGIQKVTDKVEINTFHKELNISWPYFLHVGTFQPRKNIAGLIKAYTLYRQSHTSDTKLVLTGDKGWRNKLMKEALASSPYRADIILLGYQNNQALSYLLCGARALFLVSLFEGFGMPIIEAQKCGCPVVASDVSSMPEAAGDAALLVNPHNTTAIAAAMFRMDSEPDLRQELIKKGYLNAAKYSWKTSGEKMWQMIEQIAKSKK